jgi:hypothetical protein
MFENGFTVRFDKPRTRKIVRKKGHCFNLDKVETPGSNLRRLRPTKGSAIGAVTPERGN